MISQHTRSKRPNLCTPLGIIKRRKKLEMVSATHLHNFMIDDCLVDWLKLRSRPGTRKSPVYGTKNDFTEFVMNKGIEFEDNLVRYINNTILPVTKVSEYLTDEGCAKTIEYMREGKPIIYSAPVKNTVTNTQGIIDLLVRSDIIAKLIDQPPLTKEEADIGSPNLNHNFHYVVVDIKFSTLPLRADGIHLLNSGHYPAYKAQTYVYNQAIGLIQGYTSPFAFIMGRRWKFTQKDINHSNYTCLNRLGRIDFNTVDCKYPELAQKAIDWVRDVKKNGANWSINPPSRKELYPNMCVDSGVWNQEKEKIADSIGEITNIWYLGTKHRNFGLESNITSWRDPKCTTKRLNFNGNRSAIVDKILKINRQKRDKIWPKKIMGNTSNWRCSTNEIFVDFETMSDIFADFSELPHQKCSDMIFMIGVGWVEGENWQYKNFICNRATYQEEYRIMDEFVQFVKSRGNPNIRYWYAEPSFWNQAECRQFDLAHEENDIERKDHISDEWKNIGEWTDLYNLFLNEPIVLKGCFKFGLKPIAKVMKSYGMIKTSLESYCNSGMSAMINADRCYKLCDNPVTSDTMIDIAKYNQFDCKVLWEILSYLRKNHS